MLRVLNPGLSNVLYTYYRGPDHPMKLRLWRWLRQVTGYPLLTIPYCDTAQLAIDERDLVQREVFLHGTYEPEVWESLFAHAFANEVVWDIGAHVGTFTVRTMWHPAVSAVHSFEPDPLTRRTLCVNIGLNATAASRCEVHAIALGADSGVSPLSHGPVHNQGLSCITDDSPNVRWRVQRASVDELVFERRLEPPTLMKIDVEGAEIDLFRGAQLLLATRPPKAIVFEARQEEFTTAAMLLGDDRYAVTPIRRPTGEMWPRENYLAVRRR